MRISVRTKAPVFGRRRGWRAVEAHPVVSDSLENAILNTNRRELRYIRKVETIENYDSKFSDLVESNFPRDRTPKSRTS